jgi:hypothetical protein
MSWKTKNSLWIKKMSPYKKFIVNYAIYSGEMLVDSSQIFKTKPIGCPDKLSLPLGGYPTYVKIEERLNE